MSPGNGRAGGGGVYWAWRAGKALLRSAARAAQRWRIFMVRGWLGRVRKSGRGEGTKKAAESGGLGRCRWRSGEGAGGTGRAVVGALLEKTDEFRPEAVVLGILEQLFARARARKFDLEDLADGGGRATGHHHDAVREEQRLVDIVGDHERGLLVLLPEVDEHL